MICTYNGLACMYPNNQVSPTPGVPPVKMCFLPGTMVKRNRPLIGMHIVKCEYNEVCVRAWPYDTSNVGGEDLG